MNPDETPLVLLVDGVREDRQALREQLSQHYRVVEAPNARSAAQVLESSERVDLVLTSQDLPDSNGLRMLDQVLGYWPPIPVVLMINEGEEDAAVQALQKGAADYYVKGDAGPLRLLRILANALDRSRGELAAQEHAREMGVLNAILTALNRELDEEPVLDAIVQEAQALMGTDACSIILVDTDTEQMFLRASTRLPVRDMVLPVPLHRSIAGRVVRERKGCITQDVTRDPDWYCLGLDDLIPTPVRSMLTVPLLSGGDAIGVLQLINKRVGPFLSGDLSLMESVAAVATAAITRGRQFASLRESLQKQKELAAELERAAQDIMTQTEAIEAALPASAPRSQLDAIRSQADYLRRLAAG